jgi:hypothetical protein
MAINLSHRMTHLMSHQTEAPKCNHRSTFECPAVLKKVRNKLTPPTNEH